MGIANDLKQQQINAGLAVLAQLTEDLGFSKSARKCESGNLITLCDWKDTQEPSYNALTTSLMDKGRKKILGRHYKIKCATCGQQRFSMEVVR